MAKASDIHQPRDQLYAIIKEKARPPEPHCRLSAPRMLLTTKKLTFARSYLTRVSQSDLPCGTMEVFLVQRPPWVVGCRSSRQHQRIRTFPPSRCISRIQVSITSVNFNYRRPTSNAEL